MADWSSTDDGHDVARLHLTTADADLVMICRPSGVTATGHTGPVWPVRAVCSWPLVRSHSRAVPSPPPVTAQFSRTWPRPQGSGVGQTGNRVMTWS